MEGAGALKVALDSLYPSGGIDRTDLEIAAKNSACGIDVAIYLTGARVRYGSCRLTNTFKPSEYVIRQVSTGKTVHVKVKPEVIPTRVRNQMRKIQSGQFTASDIDLFRDLQWAYARRLVSRPLSQSYNVAIVSDYQMPKPVTVEWGTRTDNAYKNTPSTAQDGGIDTKQ